MLQSRASNLLQRCSKVVTNAGLKEANKIGSIALQSKAGYATLLDTLGDAYQRVKFKVYRDPRHHLDYDKWCKIFVTEGNIGVGKTAFAEEFAKKLDLKFYGNVSTNYDVERDSSKQVTAPKMMEWYTNPKSVLQMSRNLCNDHFCQEPADYVHTCRYQNNKLVMRALQYCDALAYLLWYGRGVTMVRQFYSDDVFAHAIKEMGWMDKRFWDFYILHRDYLDEDLIPPQVVLYLDASPEQCYENVQAGNNEAEKKLPLDFYKRVEDAYRTSYIPEAEERGVNVVELDWNNPRPVMEVIEELDNLPNMLSPTNLWDIDNSQLKRVMRNAMDDCYRCSRYIYCPIEELWSQQWTQLLYETERDNWDSKYPKGYCVGEGDKWIPLKPEHPHNFLRRF
ncbi:NADH dehydrogenase [ubiquinone] 1 alpha subcomplex subunit 10, mitochondrial-like [Ciona intestinalis]